MVKVRDLFESLCHKVDIKDPVASGKALKQDYERLSMADFVKSEGGGTFALATVNVWCKAMLGLEAHEVGCLFFLDYCKGGGGIMNMRSDRKDGGQFLRLVKGT
jgi:monoamine oxidase